MWLRMRVPATSAFVHRELLAAMVLRCASVLCGGRGRCVCVWGDNSWRKVRSTSRAITSTIGASKLRRARGNDNGINFRQAAARHRENATPRRVTSRADSARHTMLAKAVLRFANSVAKHSPIYSCVTFRSQWPQQSEALIVVCNARLWAHLDSICQCNWRHTVLRKD